MFLSGQRQSRASRMMIGIGTPNRYSWLRVSGTTKTPEIDHGVGHQLHTVMALLFELEAQQQPFEFILPGEGPFQA
jgi:hypothetical protein